MIKHSLSSPNAHQHGEASKERKILDLAELWLKRHERQMLIFVLSLSALFSFLLFDAKVSPGGDDSAYIERAWRLVHEGKFPYFQGPGYPLFLSIIVKITGLNIIALKLFSVLCQLGFVWFTYKTFRIRIPFLVLFVLLIFISTSYYIQYYSSQTFTESFFLFIQSVAVFVLFRIIDISRNSLDSWTHSLRRNYREWIAFGFLFCLLSISKSVAIVAIAAVVLFFVLHRNYREAIFAIVVFLLFRIIYHVVVTSAFGEDTSNQFEMMMRKDLYKPALGHEDFMGMVVRFFDNFNTYLSVHLFRILHFRDAGSFIIFPPLAYVSAVVLALFTYISFKRNKYIFFSGIYLAVLGSAVFSGVQASNFQDRLIIIIVPFIFAVLFYGIYMLSKHSGTAQYAVLIFAGFILISVLGFSSAKAVKNIPALKNNLSGNMYYGYTPDWENFLRMSEYCADSLPADVNILSRKPNMSFIYGKGRKFLGQYWVTNTDPDSVLLAWKSLNIKYIILANIRLNPEVYDGYIINTIHRMIDPVREKYPEKIRVLKTIGTEEKCELIEILY